MMAAKTNKKDVLLQATIKKQMLINGIDTKALAGMMNMGVSTLYEKLRSPSKFTVGQIRMVCSALHFSTEEKACVL